MKKLKKRLMYEGLTKDQIRVLKKEKKHRKEWDKHKAKLQNERKEIQKMFFNNYQWNCFSHGTGGKLDDSEKPDGRIPKKMYIMQELPSPEPTVKNIKLKHAKPPPEEEPEHHVGEVTVEQKFTLQHIVDDSCHYFECMERKNAGNLEKMLTGIRDKVEDGKLNIDKREQYDPQR